jgi:hypothetical protein
VGKFIQFLLESRSADLYTGTSLVNANKILQDNILIARTPIHSTKIPQQYKQYTKTVSLTRNVQVAINFARANGASNETLPVVFVLDQDKLYRAVGKRMRPYDDLDSMEIQQRDPNTPSSRSRGHNEREEVVFGDIPNISNYIKRIIVHVPSKVDSSIPDDEQYITRRRAAEEMRKYPAVINDPRTVIRDILGKQYTYREFTNLLK